MAKLCAFCSAGSATSCMASTVTRPPRSHEVSASQVCASVGLDSQRAWDACKSVKDIPSVYTGCAIDFCASGANLELAENAIEQYQHKIGQAHGCSATDGATLSIFYPCRCGVHVCNEGESCDGNKRCIKRLNDCIDIVGKFHPGPCLCRGHQCSEHQRCSDGMCVPVPRNCTAQDGAQLSNVYPCVCGEEVCGEDWATPEQKLELCGKHEFDHTLACKEAPPECTQTGGLAISAYYPCSCANSVCSNIEICNTMASGMPCSPAPCTEKDGNIISRIYPCSCGTSTCQEGQVCGSDGLCKEKCSGPDGMGCPQGQVCGKRGCEAAPTPDPLLPEVPQAAFCSVVDGTAPSESYPCTCGKMICEENEACDSAGMGTCTLVVPCSQTDGSSLSSAYPCMCGPILCIAGELCDSDGGVCMPTADCTDEGCMTEPEPARLWAAGLGLAPLAALRPLRSLGLPFSPEALALGAAAASLAGLLVAGLLLQRWARRQPVLQLDPLLQAEEME